MPLGDDAAPGVDIAALAAPGCDAFADPVAALVFGASFAEGGAEALRLLGDGVEADFVAVDCVAAPGRSVVLISRVELQAATSATPHVIHAHWHNRLRKLDSMFFA